MKKINKRPKVECEVCGEDNTKILERHHIIPRTDPRCTNDDFNIAILCKNCHGRTHTGSLKIIGVYPGNRPPSGVILVYELDGVKNFDLDEPYFTPLPKSVKLRNNYDDGIEQDSTGCDADGGEQKAPQKDEG